MQSRRVSGSSAPACPAGPARTAGRRRMGFMTIPSGHARSVRCECGSARAAPAIRRSADARRAWRNLRSIAEEGPQMSTPVRASARDLRALAAIVSEDRTDLPDGEGLPPSLLADLTGQIRCDVLSLHGWDAGQRTCWFSQEIPSGDAAIDWEPTDQ